VLISHALLWQFSTAEERACIDAFENLPPSVRAANDSKHLFMSLLVLFANFESLPQNGKSLPAPGVERTLHDGKTNANVFKLRFRQWYAEGSGPKVLARSVYAERPHEEPTV
jgi:hypothetical protein